MAKIGFIGAGKMASAMAEGIARCGLVKNDEVIMYDICSNALEAATATRGFKKASSNEDVISKSSDLVIIAVKPQVYALMCGVFSKCPLKGKVVMSVMAGVPMQKLQSTVVDPNGVPVAIVRVAPNTPALVGKGASSYCVNGNVSSKDKEFVTAVLSSVGITQEMSESQLEAATAVAGCGPAFVYMMIESLAEGGVKAGLPLDVATRLAAQTVAGAGEMVLQTERHPASLKGDVCSPGGVTICGVAELEKYGFRNAVLSAVNAARERIDQLSSL